MLPVFWMVVRNLDPGLLRSTIALNEVSGWKEKPILGKLCISILWEGFLTTNICMINLWTLALPSDWTHCILLRTACQLAQSASIYIWGKLPAVRIVPWDWRQEKLCQLSVRHFAHYLLMDENVANIQCGV